ncbi:MAG: acyltransferase [Clostridium sp.]|nr:acyltransferase [Clostridium sp.]
MTDAQFQRKVTWLSFLCCVLVIWNHAGNADLFLPGQGTNGFLWRFEYEYAYSVIRADIPFFLMISGYRFFRGFELKKLPGKWFRRVRSLLVPYLLWNLLYYAADAAASRIPLLSEITGRTGIPVTAEEIIRAAVFFTHNPVFWFMFQLILLVILAPVIWIFLRSKAGCLVMLAGFAVLWYVWPAVPVLNPDALIYFSLGGMVAVRFRNVTEQAWSIKQLLLGCASLAAAAALYRYYRIVQTPQPIVLYSILVPAGLWLVFNERWISEDGIRPWMKETFFIYAFHFVVVRAVNKTVVRIFPGNGIVAAILFTVMPLIAVAVCHGLAGFLRKNVPPLYSLLNGGRG